MSKTIHTINSMKTSKHLSLPKAVSRHQYVLLLLALFSGLFFSCSKDKEEEVNPQERLPFLGSYQVIDRNNNNGEGAFKFKLTIAVSTQGADKVDLEGFRYVNEGVYARIKGNKMIISQVIEDSNERVEINGEGTLEADTLTYSYVLKYKQKGKQERIYENSATATRIE